MKDKYTRSLNAAEAGKAVMDDVNHAPIWNGKPAIVSKKNELDACLARIAQIDDEINDNTGKAVTKKDAKKTAARTAWKIAKALVVFAEDANNDVLKGEINFSLRHLHYAKDAVAIDRWNVISARANTHVLALDTGGYGVDATLLNTFLQQRNKFANWRAKPRAARAQTKALNKSLADEFSKLLKIVTSLKNLLVQFSDSHTAFYVAVTKAFEINMTGVRHQAIQIEYIDEETGVRLPKVKSLLVEKANEKSASVRGFTTYMQAETGPGNFTLESWLENYENIRLENIGVRMGKRTKLVVKMKKKA
jgi:hypothetical protein